WRSAKVENLQDAVIYCSPICEKMNFPGAQAKDIIRPQNIGANLPSLMRLQFPSLCKPHSYPPKKVRRWLSTTDAD
ncbi:hypothetical protein, partial [Pseudaminobacter sp. NGMCC 1.201702]|uniref:hypothetical protein n=1 Tax=Pseudaminobacter sp. NGMCC 1.201702 TaxID=3391825 RepID=UPI0039EF3933